MSFELTWRPQSPWGEACTLWNFPIASIQYLSLGSIETFLRGWGDFVHDVGFNRENFQGRGKFLGFWTLKGKFYTDGNWQNSNSKFFLFVLIVCQLNFARGDVLGTLYGGFFSACWIGKNFPHKGRFLEWLGKQSEIKLFFKWKYAKENFSGWIVLKKFYEGGFTARSKYYRGVHIKWGKVFTD